MAAAQGDVTVALDYRRLRALYKLVPNLLRTDIFCLFVNSSESPAWLTMISYALALCGGDLIMSLTVVVARSSLLYCT